MHRHWRNLRNGISIGDHQTRHSILFLLLVGMALHFFGIATPGYYNHDETQYFVISQEMEESLRKVWIDHYHKSQWRPLSRTVQLLLSRGLYETPILLHTTIFLIVIASAVLFYFLLLRIFKQPLASIAGFVTFCAFPSTAWVIGWVATIADGLTMLITMIMAHILLTDRNETIEKHPRPGRFYQDLRNESLARQSLLALLFALGLLCKESIVILPLALVGLCLFTKPWRGLFLASCSTGIIAVVFLILRMDMIFSNSELYSISTNNLFNNAFLYWQYPWNLRTLEIHSPPIKTIAAWAYFSATLAFSPIFYLLYQRKFRGAVAFVFQYFIFISPALLIPRTAAHYMYGAVLPVAVVFVLSFRQKECVWIKLCASALIGILLLHSVLIQFYIYESGRVQTRIHNTVSSIIASHDMSCGHQNTQFTIIPDKGAKSYYMYRALTSVTSIESVPIKGRLNLFREHNQERHENFLEGNEVPLAFNSESRIIEHRHCP